MSPAADRKVAVITWSVNHNPVGRAHVLAELVARAGFDVEIVGYEFPAYGSGVWAPVRDGRIPIKVYAGESFPEQLELMHAVGRTLKADAVLVSKPRLPGLATGAFAKESCPRGLVVDVDDWELSFVGAAAPVGLDDEDAIRRDDTVLTPYGRIWTQVCEPLIGSADARTVSNLTLQSRFGGTIIPHARDESLFDPQRFDRATVRARLGIDPDVRLLLFGGTPRRHKGVLDLARAVVELGDPTVVLGLIATRELGELRAELDRIGCPLVAIPPQPFEDMPAVLLAADFAAVLQDPASPISEHQMPAKITDALAMQVPCIVNDVAPLRPLIEAGCLEVVGPDGLTATLKRLLDDELAVRTRAMANRELFLEHFSHAAVAPRLGDVIASSIDARAPLDDGLRDLLAVQRSLFGTTALASASSSSLVGASSAVDERRRRPRPRRRPAEGAQYDLVVFWKQNDSGIYGRRSDLLLRELSRSGRVARMIHFDAPIGIEALRRCGQSDGSDHDQFVFETTIRRVLGEEDEEGCSRHTFLFDDRGDRFDLPRRDQFSDFVAEVLDEHRIGSRDVIFWVYPTNDELPGLIDRFRPQIVVADVVDDNRTWYPAGSSRYQALTENYRAVLGRSDVVLANCAAVRDAMAEFHDDVHVVPNACEPPEPTAPLAREDVPAELAELRGPIIGYVGNLSSRIDIALLEHLAVTRPDWNLVLIGSAHAGRDVLATARHRNVSILGPRRHDDARRYVRAFDVAIIPHLDNEMTRSMQPLKAFVYCSLGVPVVSTEIPNLDQLRSMITVAREPDEFVVAIERALRRGRRPLTKQQMATLRANSWPVRAAKALELIDEWAARPGPARLLHGPSRRQGSP